MSNDNHTGSADEVLGALMVHVASSVGLLTAVGVPSHAIAKALLGAAVSYGREAVGPFELAEALRHVADDMDRQETLRASMTAGSA